MNFCAKCHFTIWPYLIAVFIAGVTAFLTWVILGYSDFDVIERTLIIVATFLATGVSLSYYMMMCMQRHCHHNHKHHTNSHHHHSKKFSSRQPPVRA